MNEAAAHIKLAGKHCGASVARNDMLSTRAVIKQRNYFALSTFEIPDLR